MAAEKTGLVSVETVLWQSLPTVDPNANKKLPSLRARLPPQAGARHVYLKSEKKKVHLSNISEKN